MSKARGLASLGNVYDDGALSNRNLIINGAMQVWQRGTSGFGHSVYFADRWVEYTNTDDGLSISLVEIPSGGETGLPTQLTQMAKFALTAGSAGGLNDLRQKVENPKGLMGQTVTLSYYIKASANCTINNRRIEFGSVTNAPASSDLPSVNVTTEWQRVVDTVTLNSSGSAVFSASSHLDVILSLPVHTTVDVYLTGVQLEVGDTATPFEHRSYGQELALCQRYYHNTYSSINGVMVGYTGYVPTTANRAYRVGIQHPVTMRTAPSISMFGVVRIWDGTTTSPYSSAVTIFANNKTVDFDAITATDLNDHRPCRFYQTSTADYIAFDAEL